LPFILSTLLPSILLPAFLSPTPQAPSVAQEIRVLHGPHDQARFGASVAAVGDVDADGFGDVLVGAIGVRGVGKRSGAAVVYSGKSGAPLHELTGDGPWSELGAATAAVGDLDGDGHADFAVGAPFDGEGNSRTGSVIIVSGRSGGVLQVIPGAAPREAVGTALCAVGDLTGDGHPELAIGAPGWSQDGFRKGMVRIYDPVDGRLVRELPGVAADGGTGLSLAAAGDVDRDGLPDLMVAAPAEDRAGMVRIHSGKSGAVLLEIPGEQEHARFGSSLCGLGDVNGDGVPELAIGAPGFDNGRDDVGRVAVYSGADGERLYTHDGEADDTRVGAALAAAGDLDQDGRNDFLVGGTGVRGTGVVWALSGADGGVLHRILGSEQGEKFGAALAAGGYDGDTALLAIAAPDAEHSGPMAGRVRLYTMRAAPLQPVAAAGTEPGSAAPAALPAASLNFLDDKLPSKFRRIEAADGRWVFYSTMGATETRDAVKLIDRAYARLDEVLGGPALGPRAATQAPVILSYVSSLSDQKRISREVGRQFEHLAGWTKEWGGLPQMILWNPLLSTIRHDETTALVQRPEMQVLHHAVHLELVRRYGPVPGWIPEAISYGIQDEITGEIYAYSNRGWEQLSEDYHQIWREHASDLWVDGPMPTLDSLFGGRHDAFRQHQAYGRFGIGLWMLKDPQRRLAQLFEAIQERRAPNMLPETDYKPEPDVHRKLLTSVYGDDMRQQASSFWGSVTLAGGPRARRAAALASIEDAITTLKLHTAKSRDGQLRLASDLSPKATSKILKSSESVLGRLSKATDTRLPKDTQLTIFVLRDQDAYRQVCDGISEAAPGLGAYLKVMRESTGFLLPDMPVAAYWDDIKFQEQTRPDQSVAHSVVHLWLRQRFGQLPLWLSEGLACASEEVEFRDVWGMWNLEGFVYDASRSAWRETAREYVTTKEDTIRCYGWSGVTYGTEPPRVEKPKPTLEQLYEYPATTFQDDLAHLAFAFAIYGLEGDKKGFREFLDALQEEYDANWSTVGRFEPDAKLVERLVKKSFGRDFERRFVDWWSKKGAKRPRR